MNMALGADVVLNHHHYHHHHHDYVIAPMNIALAVDIVLNHQHHCQHHHHRHYMTVTVNIANTVSSPSPSEYGSCCYVRSSSVSMEADEVRTQSLRRLDLK